MVFYIIPLFGMHHSTQLVSNCWVPSMKSPFKEDNFARLVQNATVVKFSLLGPNDIHPSKRCLHLPTEP